MNKKGMLRRRRQNGQKRLFVVLCTAAAVFLAYNLINVLRTVDFARYYGTEDVLYINTAKSGKAQSEDIRYENGEIYLPFDLVKNDIDANIYRSDEGDRIIITTDESVIRMRSDSNEAYVNGEALSLNMPVYNSDYLPASVLEQFYPVRIEYSGKSNTVTVSYTDKTYYTSELKRSVYLRYEPKRTSFSSAKLKKGSTVKTLSPEGKYLLVTTQDGLCGYIPSSAAGEAVSVSPSEVQPQPKQLWKCTDGRANIVFDQVTNSAANTDDERIPLHSGVDVICTTWFSFENTNGDIRNLADRSYVDKAHAQGIRVWGLITDNFDGSISHSVLSDADTREHVIKQLLAYSALYDLDGINIDFEAVPADDGELFVQFIRELAPMLHNEGLTLSADFFVPKPWTYHYNRGRCAEVLDYAIVMGYDQHYAGSDTAGSNAEIGWSEEAVTASLAQGIPKDKLLLGIPFYTRVWTINNSSGELSQKAMGMQSAKDFMASVGAETRLLESAGQNYAEANDGTNTYKCWFEDEYSVGRRLALAEKYDIAGTAAWKSGMETDDIWGLLKNELKK